MDNTAHEAEACWAMGVRVKQLNSALLNHSVPDEAALHEQQMGQNVVQDRKDVHDIIGEFSLPRQTPTGPMDLSTLSIHEKIYKDNGSPNDTEDEVLPVPIPTFSTGITTFAYQRVLRNRIRSGRLARGGDYDTRAFTPTFVHDCLMLPGSLANVLGKGSSEQIIHRMTPALLPGFRAHVHIDTEQPCLIQSKDPKDLAHGMLIFGEGRDGRDQIHEHYRPHAKRIKVQVETEIVVPVKSDDRKTSRERWMLKRKPLWAHAWLWSNVIDFAAQFRLDLGGWKLEEYLAGKYAINQALRVGCGVGEDYEVGDGPDEEPEGGVDVRTFDDLVWVPEPMLEPTSSKVDGETNAESGEVGEERDEEPTGMSYGGIESLSYERSDDAVGWW